MLAFLLSVGMQADTLSVIDASKVAEFYSSMMDKQATQFTILITTMCGIMVFIVGATWWWNFKGAKRQIREEIGNSKRAFQRLFKISTSEMENSLNVSLEQKLTDQLKKVNKEIEDYKNSTTEAIEFQQAELSRVFALHCDSKKSSFTAATWWFSAATLYNKCENEKFTQISVNAGLNSLKAVDASKLDEDDLVKLEEILTEVGALPELLFSQKKDIKKLIKTMKADIETREKGSIKVKNKG